MRAWWCQGDQSRAYFQIQLSDEEGESLAMVGTAPPRNGAVEGVMRKDLEHPRLEWESCGEGELLRTSSRAEAPLRVEGIVLPQE